MSPRNNKQTHRIEPPYLPDISELGTFPSILEPGTRYSDLKLKEGDISGSSLDRLFIEYLQAEESTFADTHFRSLKLRDARLLKCDLSNADWSYATLERIEFVSDRLTGFKANEAQFADVKLIGCKANLAQFRNASFRDVAFEECVLTDADFTGADLRGVSFAGCDMTGVTLAGAKLENADFRGATLDGIRIQPSDFKGIIIDEEQAFILSSLFAQLLGITVLPK